MRLLGLFVRLERLDLVIQEFVPLGFGLERLRSALLGIEDIEARLRFVEAIREL